MMKHYEFTYLTRLDMPEDAAKELSDKLAGSITAKNGIIVDLPKAYKKRLAYRIKKQDVAYVNTILFQTEPALAVEFKKEADTIADILRGLVIFYDPEKLKKEIRRERPMAKELPSEPMPPAQSFAGKPAAKAAETPALEPEKTVKAEKEKEPEAKKEAAKEEKPAAAKASDPSSEAPAKEGETAPAKPKRRTKIKAELRDIEEKLDEILK